MPMRPMRRMAVTGAVGYGAYRAGQSRQAGKQKAADDEARLAALEAKQTAAAPAPEGATNLDELKTLADLRDSGALTQEEFDLEKAKILAS